MSADIIQRATIQKHITQGILLMNNKEGKYKNTQQQETNNHWVQDITITTSASKA